MKLIQTLSRLIPKLFISLSILCWIPSGSWGQNNLVQNGDVEIGNGSTPDYWTTGAWRLPYAQFTWDQTDAYSGSKSLHISVNAAQPTDAFWYQNVTGRIEPGKVYNVRAWVKGENITAQGSYGATVGLESGIPPYSTSLGAALGTASLGSFGWQQYEGTVRVKPTGSNPIVLAARLGGNANLASGNVWFDDIHIDDDFTHIAAKKHIYFDFETNDIAARITPQNLSLWQDRLDSVYDALEDLTGLSNQNGDSLGIYTTRQDLGNAEALGGNPIPWVRRYFLPKLSDVNNRGSWSWTMFHEISHRFDHPTWTFEAEIMSNFKVYFALDSLDAKIDFYGPSGPLFDATAYKQEHKNLYDQTKAYFVSTGIYSIPHGPSYGNAVVYRLIEIADHIGWEAVKRAFRSMQMENDPGTILGRFDFMLDAFSQEAGYNVRCLFPDGEYLEMKRYLNCGNNGGYCDLEETEFICEWITSESIHEHLEEIPLAASSIDLKGEQIIVGIPTQNKAMIFQLNAWGNWQAVKTFEMHDYLSSPHSDYQIRDFGKAVGLIGDYALISYFYDYQMTAPGNYASSTENAYQTIVLKKTTSGWIHDQTISAGEFIDTENQRVILSENLFHVDITANPGGLNDEYSYTDGGVQVFELNPQGLGFLGRYYNHGSFVGIPPEPGSITFAKLSSQEDKILAFLPDFSDGGGVQTPGWVQLDILPDSQLTLNHDFGITDFSGLGDIDGSFLALNENGKGKIFYQHTSTWTVEEEISGNAVSVRGDRILAGDPYGTSHGQGKVDLYRTLNGDWTKMGELYEQPRHDQNHFGKLILDDGDKVAILSNQKVHILQDSMIDAGETILGVQFDTELFVDLSWIATPHAQAYILERQIDQGSYVPVQHLDGTTPMLNAQDLSYTDTLLSFGVPVSYRLLVLPGAYSNEVHVSQPAQIQRLDLTYDCYNPVDNTFKWRVYNPNALNVLYIYAQWFSSQRDTLIAPPGYSSFLTTNNPTQSYEEDITGIWWIDERLLPGEPYDIVWTVDPSQTCSSQRTATSQAPKADPGTLNGMLQPFMQVNFPDLEEVKEIFVDDVVKVYPNPLEGVLHVEFEVPPLQAKVRLLDISGNMLMEEEMKDSRNLILQTGKLASGVYLLEIVVEGERWTVKKLIK